MARSSIGCMISILPLVLCMSSLLGQQASGCHPDDLKSLLAFKSGIVVDSHGLLSTWKADSDCCIWDGIICDPLTGRVTYLYRSGINREENGTITHASMTGTISPSLGSLTSLLSIDLSSLKQLSGSIPSSFGSLSSLLYVRLDNNRLSGEIPAGVLNVPDLLEFRVFNNGLSGRIPTHKAKLDADSFKGNPDLCGEPLPPCKQ